MRFALLGKNLSHTLSPFVHSLLCGDEYDIVDIQSLSGIEKALSNYDGINVTVPYKIEILNYLSDLEGVAKTIGSVNTVSRENNSFIGHNTDAEGFENALKINNAKLQGDVLIIGTGGTARTFAYIASKHECNIFVRSRSRKRADDFCEYVKTNFGTATPYMDDEPHHFDYILNATPVGMYPDLMGKSPVSEKTVQNADCVFDAVYNPTKTALSKICRDNGVKYINGVAMLVYQAAASHKIWRGVSFDDETLRGIIKKTEEYINTNFCGRK